MTKWFCKKYNGERNCYSKTITVRLFKDKKWFFIRKNDFVKGDLCSDFTFIILGVYFKYTDWSYNYRLKNVNELLEIRNKKISKIKKEIKK